MSNKATFPGGRIPNIEEKMKTLIEDWLELRVVGMELSMVESMETLLEIISPEDMETIGLGDTMHEYLEADDRIDEDI